MFLHSVHGRHVRLWVKIARVSVMILWALSALAWAPAASAHAALVASDPSASAVLQSAPREASLSFDEPVAPLVFKIAQPDGTLTDLRHVVADQNRLTLALPALSQRGTYALSWRVISADGHPVGGSLLFSIGTASAQAIAAPAATVRNGLIWFTRLAWFVGLLAGVGLSLFQACGTRQPVANRRLAYSLAGAGAIAALASLGLLGVDALDAPLASLLDASTWRTAFASSFAAAVLLSWVALGLAALSTRAAPGWGKKTPALGALVVLGLALASSGHASTAPPAWVARPAVWLHVTAATLWVGTLVPLGLALRDPPDLKALQGFSRRIPGALLVLIASGATIICLQFDHVSSLWQTAYGRVLGAKLLLVAILLALGACNRWRLTGAVLAGSARARQFMRRSIVAECLLALGVLAVVSLWRFTPPPRALDAAQTAAPQATRQVSVHIHAREAMAQVVLDPPSGEQPGILTLYLFKGDFTPLQAQEVGVVFSNKDAGIEPIHYAAHHAPDDTWRIDAIQLPKLSHWQLEVDALVSDFERIRLRTSLQLAP